MDQTSVRSKKHSGVQGAQRLVFSILWQNTKSVHFGPFAYCIRCHAIFSVLTLRIFLGYQLGSQMREALSVVYPKSQSLRVGVVMRRAPGVTRWAKWVWKAVAVLPGASDADWKELRSEGDVTEYHADTQDLVLYASDTEAYVHELGTRVPSVYVILRPEEESANSMPLSVLRVTASPYEAQDYADSGEEIVEKVAMPPALLAWVTAYVDQHHVEEPFVKRRRDKKRVDLQDDGVGDARIAQASDVYRAPKRKSQEAAE